MIGLRTKREEELILPVSEDLIQLLKLATQLLRSKSINRPALNESLRLLESLKIDIQAKLVSHVN